MDELLKDPPRLPRGLEQHERRASRVDVNVSEALNSEPYTHASFRHYIQIRPSIPPFSRSTSIKTIPNSVTTWILVRESQTG